MRAIGRTIGSLLLALGLALLTLGWTAAPAGAEEPEADEVIVSTAASPDSSPAAVGAPRQPDSERYPLLDVPTKPWAYDTGYYFALTRGLGDEGLKGVRRGFAMVGTVPMDVVTLPGAMLAGLFGS